MGATDGFRKAERPNGSATMMAIGTANPVFAVDQITYPEYYFRVTNSEHMTDLKEKFERMCAKSMIKNRYLHLTEDILKENPNIGSYNAPSLDARQKILTLEIPKLAKEAATKAIEEWGQPKSKITHLVFTSTGGVDAPGADFHLTELLGLQPSVQRYMLYQQGCYGGATALRLAKDIAENNAGARVLVVSCEITVCTFHGPCSKRPDNLLGQALFGDGAGAIIVGADPIMGVEKPLFEMVSVAQTIIPGSGGAINIHLGQEGWNVYLQKNVCDLISTNIEKILEDEVKPFGISDWNSLFFIVHPGGSRILNQVEGALNLNTDKLLATRQVLSEYGNMACAAVFFILDKMRRVSAKKGINTTGEGLEWGVLFGLGPGITVETIVLRSAPI